MSVNRRKYDKEFKKNVVKLSYANPKGVRQVAADLGIAKSFLYRLRQVYTAQDDKTRYVTLE